MTQPEKKIALRDGLTELRNQLGEMRDKFIAMLPPAITADRFMSVIMTAVQLEPKLLECDRKSLLIAAARCANDGLIPDGREAALVPFRDTKANVLMAQHMPMIGGILKRARNSGEIASVSVNVVCERDYFRYKLGDDERIEHEPVLNGERGKLIAVYAVVKTKDGAVYRDVMGREDIDRRRQASAAPNSPAWVKWYDEQAMKTVLKHCLKRAPQSTVMDRLLGTETIAAPQPAAIEALRGTQLPDPESTERTVYALTSDALEAINAAEQIDQVEAIYKLAVGEINKLQADVPIRFEALKNDRIEVLRQRQGAAT